MDALDLNAIGARKLTDEQMTQLLRYAGASTKTFHAGEAPFHAVGTGIELGHSRHWTLKRQPFLLETSRPAVFAAGDVRFASVKRVASAVGEGSWQSSSFEYLKTMPSDD
jgi:thioredoxin reductase